MSTKEGAVIFHIDLITGRITSVGLEPTSIAQSCEVNPEPLVPVNDILPTNQETNPRTSPEHCGLEKGRISLRRLKALMRSK